MKNILLILILLSLGARHNTSEPKFQNCVEESNEKLLNYSIEKKIKVLDVFGHDYPNLTFESIELVSIETLPDVLIGKFSQLLLKFEKDNIYISNSVNHPEILRFNRAGKFLATIGKYGGGPKEFSSIEDFCIHGDTVDVLCGMGDGVKIVGYKNNGTFLYSKPINLVAYSFEWTSPGYIFETSYSKVYSFRTYTTDINGKITGSYLPNTTGFAMAFAGKNFERVGSRVYRKEGYVNEVQIAEESDFYPAYNLDLGSFAVPDEYFKSNPVQAFQLLQKRAFASILNYFETPSYALFNIRQKPKSTSGLKDYIDHIYVLDKSTDKLTKSSFKMQSEDFFKYPLSGTMYDEIVFLIYPYMIYNDKTAFKNLAIKNPEIMDKLKVDDNPLLMFVKLKK